MRWPWQRRVGPEAAQQRPRVVPPRRDWMGLAPLQRTVPSTTLTTATDGFSSRLASRSARPLVQPLTHGVMHDAPTGHLDGVARPSAAEAPRVEPPAHPDLPLAGDRVAAQRATTMRRTSLTAAPATAAPGRRLRAAPPVQRQAAGPEAVTPVVQSPADTSMSAGTDRVEPEAGGTGTLAPAQHTDLALAADPPALPGAPGGTPLDAPSAGSPMTGSQPRGSASGPPSPGPPAAGHRPVQRATLADSPRPPRRSGLGAPLVSPVQRAAVQRSQTAAPGGSPGAPAQPGPGLPLRESPTTAGAPSTPPAGTAGSGGTDSGGMDSGGVAPTVTGAVTQVTGPDVPTIGERTPPATLDVQRSTRGDGADDGPASSAVVTPAAPQPDGAPVVLPLQRATGPSAGSGAAGSSAGSGATPAPSPRDVRRPGGTASDGGSPAVAAGAGESGSALPLQRSHTTADAHAHTVETGTTGTAPAVPGDATAPAGADAPPQEVGADVAVVSPHVPPPLVPRPAAGMVSMPLLGQRAPLLQRMPAAGTDGEVDITSLPSPDAAGPPAGGVTRATQMSATVPSPRGGQGSGPRGTQPGRTVQPLRRAGHGAGAPVPPSPPVTPVQPGSPATSGTAGSPGVSDAWASPGVPAHAGGDASMVIPGGGAPVAGPSGAADGDMFVQTLTPAPSPAARGPVMTAVAAGVQRLTARAARGTGTQAPASRGEGAAMTFPARDRARGPGGTAVARSRAVAGPDAPSGGGVDLTMPSVQLRAAHDGGTATQAVPVQTLATAAPAAAARAVSATPAPPVTAAAAPPVLQRAPEPAEVAETPPSAAAPVAAVTAGAAAAAGGMPRSEEDLDVLAGRLYDHIAGRLRRELRVDRERTGLLTDLQG